MKKPKDAKLDLRRLSGRTVESLTDDELRDLEQEAKVERSAREHFAALQRLVDDAGGELDERRFKEIRFWEVLEMCARNGIRVAFSPETPDEDRLPDENDPEVEEDDER